MNNEINIDEIDNPIRELRLKCSMDYWWPKLSELDVRTPETIRLEAYEKEIEDSSDAEGGFTVTMPDEDELIEAVKEVDGPPAFFRSDQTSAKHRMSEGSKIDSLDEDTLRLRKITVAERHKMGMGIPSVRAYYIREWLDLWSTFKAFTGTPIAVELRFFIYDNEVKQYGFYWPEDAIRRPDTDDWEKKWAGLERVALDPSNVSLAKDAAEKVADEFDGYWSVDFALTKDRVWHCIDMARGELSWHPDSCDVLRREEDYVEENK